MNRSHTPIQNGLMQMGGSAALFSILSPGLIDAVIKIAVVKRYQAGQLIQSRGNAHAGLCVVKSGVIKIGVYGKDGVFVMASMLGPGESFGEFTLFTELPRTHDISAVGDCEIYQVPKVEFTKLVSQEPSLLKALLKSALVRTHLLLELLDASRRLPKLEYAAYGILSLSYTSGSADTVQCKHNDLANWLGMTRVTLGKVLKQLAEKGLITLGYGKIVIPERDALEAWLASRNNTPLQTEMNIDR